MDVVVGGVRLDSLRRGVSDHTPQQCDGGPCPLHTVSRHHMVTWPQWHGTRMNLTLRQCPHGGYHPDPDDVRWAYREVDAHRAEECDRCCTERVPVGDMSLGGAHLGPLKAGVADHSGRHCDGDGACPLHDPTPHGMREWPVFHGTVMNLTVRMCPHGSLHPDPDDRRWGSGVHDCDGCCRPA